MANTNSEDHDIQVARDSINNLVSQISKHVSTLADNDIQVSITITYQRGMNQRDENGKLSNYIAASIVEQKRNLVESVRIFD